MLRGLDPKRRTLVYLCGMVFTMVSLSFASVPLYDWFCRVTMQREMEVRIGETGLAFYEAYNPTDRPIAGSASYNVFPFTVGGFFTKIDCFCFEEQVLQPGERVQMPVTFFVDPEIVEDRDGKYVDVITLSYTFYEIPLEEAQAALDIEAGTVENIETN